MAAVELKATPAPAAAATTSPAATPLPPGTVEAVQSPVVSEPQEAGKTDAAERKARREALAAGTAEMLPPPRDAPASSSSSKADVSRFMSSSSKPILSAEAQKAVDEQTEKEKKEATAEDELFRKKKALSQHVRNRTLTEFLTIIERRKEVFTFAHLWTQDPKSLTDTLIGGHKNASRHHHYYPLIESNPESAVILAKRQLYEVAEYSAKQVRNMDYKGVQLIICVDVTSDLSTMVVIFEVLFSDRGPSLLILDSKGKAVGRLPDESPAAAAAPAPAAPAPAAAAAPTAAAVVATPAPAGPGKTGKKKSKSVV